MKRSFVFTLVLSLVVAAMAIGLVSCGGGSSDTKMQAGDSTAAATSTDSAPSTDTMATKDESSADMTEPAKVTNDAASMVRPKTGPGSVVGYDLDGKRFELAQLIGSQPTVVNFWGTWCPPCRREIPDLVKLYKEYSPKGVAMVGIAINDTPQRVRNFAEKNDMGWYLLMYNNTMLEPFKLGNSVPTTIFYNAQGKELARFVGGRNYETFKAEFEKILSSAS